MADLNLTRFPSFWRQLRAVLCGAFSGTVALHGSVHLARSCGGFVFWWDASFLGVAGVTMAVVTAPQTRYTAAFTAAHRPPSCRASILVTRHSSGSSVVETSPSRHAGTICRTLYSARTTVIISPSQVFDGGPSSAASYFLREGHALRGAVSTPTLSSARPLSPKICRALTSLFSLLSACDRTTSAAPPFSGTG